MDSQIRRMLRDYQSTSDHSLLPKISHLLRREGIVVTQPLATIKLGLTDYPVEEIISCSISDDASLFATISRLRGGDVVLHLWNAFTGDLIKEYKYLDIREAIFVNSQTLLCIGLRNIFLQNLINDTILDLERAEKANLFIYRYAFNKASNELFYERRATDTDVGFALGPEGPVLIARIVNITNGHHVQLAGNFYPDKSSGRSHSADPVFLSGNTIIVSTLASDYTDTLQIYSTITGDLLRQIVPPSGVSSFAVSPDETLCMILSRIYNYQGGQLVGSNDQYCLYDLNSGDILHTKTVRGAVSVCKFSPDSSQILIGIDLPIVGRSQWSYRSQEIPVLMLIDATTGIQRTLMISPSREDALVHGVPTGPMVRSISFADFLNGGESIISGEIISSKLSSSLRIWDSKSGEELSRFGELEGSITCCSISNDSTKLLAGSTKKLRDAEGIGWMGGRYAHGPVTNVLEMWYLGP